jgi:hypothetical protein
VLQAALLLEVLLLGLLLLLGELRQKPLTDG